MVTREFLENVCNEIKYKPVRNNIAEELEMHICDVKDEYIINGMEEKEAEEKAVFIMGNAKDIGKKLNKIHRPKFEWKILLIILIFVFIRIFLNVNQYIGRYSSWSINKDIFFIITSLLLGTIIYFCDYRKTKNISKIIYMIATGIIVLQWLNWHFNIDTTISKMIHKIIGDEKRASSILNMNLWYLSIILYVISFAGNLIKDKKVNLILMYSFSVVLIYLQSNSIANTIILIITYLCMFSFKSIKENKKNYKDMIIISIIILFVSISIMLLLQCFIVDTVEKIYIENSEYQEEKYNTLNNLEMFGGNSEKYFTNTNSEFLQLLSTIGIVPSSIIVFFIIIMSIVLVIDLKNIQDTYGRFLMIGIGTLYIIQSVVHIFMNLNILPISNVNLPFLSNGNLFLLINTIGFATIMSVYRRKDIVFINQENKGENECI